MGVNFKRLKGFADMFADRSRLFALMESNARKIFSRYEYRELRTPILESTDLFQRSIGDETDVVKKEMFTFSDRKGRSVTLRPEATAGVMRAAIEAGLDKPGIINRFFTIGPMFRYERPQMGRMRQFHQINCECLGSSSPYADAEIICMLLAFLSSLKLAGLKLKLNSLGCGNCRPRYLEALKNFLRDKRGSLCADCQRRATENPLRVIDCKEPACRALCLDAPRLMDYNCPDCIAHIEKVTGLLTGQGLEMEIDHHLVRGLDYYFRTTFEIVSGDIGAQTAVAGGGRYDGLISQLGGGDIPGIGFACGMERLALLIKDPEEAFPDFYMLCPDDENRDKAFGIVQDLRKNGFSGEMNYQGGGFKSLMRQAAKSRARFCLIFGMDEARQNCVTFRNMETGNQEKFPLADFMDEFRKIIRACPEA